MHGGIRYFFDSYALIAIVSGAEEYEGFEVTGGVTTVLNLMEVQYALYRRRLQEGRVREKISDMLPLCIGFSDEDCFEAVKFRFQNKKRRLSYIDCLGYFLAGKNKVPFVTGDKEFEAMENVEFVRWAE